MQNLSYCTAAVNEVASLADKPNASGMTAAQLKAKFDASGAAIKEYINEALVPYVNNTMNPAIEDAAKTVADGTVTTEKLASGLVVPIDKGGTGNTTGLAASATKLATARTIRANLASTSTASFDGTGNITPGVTGTLPIANGGTGATTAANAVKAFFPSSFSTPGYVCSMDSSGYSGGGGYTTLAQLKTALGTVSIKKLWTNASPTSSFAAQQITPISTDNYNFIYVTFSLSTTYPNVGISVLGVCSNSVSENVYYCSDYGNLKRSFWGNNGDVYFTNGEINGSTGNAYMIPRYVYGVKGAT